MTHKVSHKSALGNLLRAARKRMDQTHESVGGGPYCLHGEKVGGTVCKFHGDPDTERAANVMAVLLDEFHEIDYDSCSFDEAGMVEVLRELIEEARSEGFANGYSDGIAYADASR